MNLVQALETDNISMEEIKELWVDKYAPKTLDDYIINSDLREYFKAMVANNAP